VRTGTRAVPALGGSTQGLPWGRSESQGPAAQSEGPVFAGLESVITGRRNVSARRLLAPGPSATQLQALLGLAAAAPDHGQLQPWRFVLVPLEQRLRLADAFVSALIARDPSATQEQIAMAAEKAQRAPLLLLAVCSTGPAEHGIPSAERLVSLGAAIQNMLLGATAMGFGSGLSSGQSMDSAALRSLFSLGAQESAICFVNIGTVEEARLGKKLRSSVAEILSILGQTIYSAPA